MRIKVDIDLEVSPRVKRLLLMAIPVGVLLGGGAIAWAGGLLTWNQGGTLKAADLNANFAYLQGEITALQITTCPPGYTQMGSAPPTVCVKGQDHVVLVGTGASAFWIDQFEATLVDATAMAVSTGNGPSVTATFPLNGQWVGSNPTYHAESRTGATPTSAITWLQANAACRASGKRLPTATEWLTAATGTPDPGVSDGTGGTCRTQGAGPRSTGLGTNCASDWGAQDMIGNVSEMTDEWFAGVGDGTPSATWPDAGGESFGNDVTGNITSTVNLIGSVKGVGIPSIGLRGGTFGDGTGAGVFAISLTSSPGDGSPAAGFRCVTPR